ncbi:MAG: DEAD/DEAH box helicase, partial [Synergistaceae bacterium]|nr:DEAD/DEAH box helicase [Synergistaceae bacterium]
MSALDSIIDKINADSDKGKMFENLCLYFLKNDRLQQERFSHVWHWDEWPGNNGEPDTGIDIVAKLRDSESYCAVQCKFRQNDSSISKQEIDSFLALSSKKEFSERIIFALTDDFNRHAENTLKGQSPDVKIFTRETLESSNIDWDSFKFDKPEIVSHKAKEFRKYQEDAINDVLNGLATHDRGKLIMACGTGKTFTSMKIAEKFAGKGGVVLVLVPSISLMNQTIIAWNNDHDENLHLIQFAVCSDSTVGKKTYPDEDMKPENLALDATTNVKDLITEWEKQTRKSESMTVIFSTYQSLKVIHDAQQTENGFPVFDLVICDEAHRTAGVSQNARMIQNEFDANFQAVHDDSFIHARKRLYMTATPKVFGDTPERKAAIKKKAEEHNAVLYSMDDENIYGPEFHRLSFSKAVEAKLLADYKVMVFMVKEGESKELTNAAKLDGIRTALAKDIQQEDYDFIAADPKPMKRAVNFTSTIIESRDVFKPHIPGTVTTTPIDGSQSPAEISFKAQHIDGTQSASERSRVIRWLKDDPAPGECRILSNARCLSEGVDVPALDAVIFFSPKRSQIDIVQSVGRVMRKAEGKNFGYVILPVAIKPGEIPYEELDNSKEYKAVWEVLQALRSHDDNFNATINSLDFNGKSDKVRVIGHPRLTEYFTPEEIDAWKQAVYVRMVRKCGDREYWDKWVSDLAAVADSHTQSLQSALEIPGAKIAFNDFADDLRHTINPSISNDDAVSMLAQHIVSKRVFDELFTEFSHLNPVSQALQRIISRLASFGFKADDSRLEKFYADVRSKVSAVKTDTGKQEVIRQIYDSFFRIAFPKMAQKLGIVYTPVAIVDFILKSSDWAVRNILNIDEGLASYNVQILDPFSGTGTFTARLIQSGIIKRGRLTWKYNNGQIFANEILLLPYYISAVNIEAAFTQINDGEYSEFPGMVLADTFMLDPLAQQQVLHPIFRENGERAHKETQSDVNIIIGNPPYSVGQKNANDNNQNTIYPALRGLVKSSYAKESTATNKNSLYDSYILAFKWASERLKGSRGVICFVTNGSFIDSNSADGMRKCLAEDFAYIYIFNLRGNQRAADWRKEGEKVFGEGSQCPVAVTMLVKDESRKGKPCEIYYYEVGDYMKRDEKLAELERLGDFGKMISAGLMRRIRPNDAGDWVTQRAEIYSEFVNLGNKKEDRPAIFEERYSAGVKTNRDSWCYNFSRESLCANMAGMIEVYNSERERWNLSGEGRIADFVTNDPAKISWDSNLFRHFTRNTHGEFLDGAVRVSLYRPYVKEYLYFSGIFNNSVHRMFSIFPEHDTKNLVISIPGIGSKKDFSVLMTDCIPEVQMMMNGQCFPLYWYTRGEQMRLFESGLVRHDGISDSALVEFRTHYGDSAITKEDIFYYVYGVLSSLEHALRFGNEAKKVLARV